MRKPGPRLQCSHGPAPRHGTRTHAAYCTHRFGSLAGATLAPQTREKTLNLGKQRRAERPERLVEAGAARRRLRGLARLPHPGFQCPLGNP
jgi:hypothetical protein